MNDPSPERRPRRRRRPRTVECPLCHETVVFCWQCRCGFHMCQACMNENLWGVTCNHITWHCPDCGKTNGFGNQ